MKKRIVFGIALSLTISLLSSMLFPTSIQSSSLPSQESKTAQFPVNNEVYLYLGSPLLLSQDKIYPLDPKNLDVAATVIDNRTFVPLRALSEYFKADVSYNAAERKAVISYNGKRYIFPIGEKKYIIEDILNKKEILMDTKTTILNQRTMVPLRVICEDILKRKVTYYNKIIAVSDNELNLKENKDLTANVKLKIGSAIKAQSLEQIKSIITQNIYRNYVDLSAAKSENLAVSDAIESEASTAAVDYSSTNTQVQGIDEADIVKTDGKCIFIAGNNAVRIVSADNAGLLKDTATIRLPQNKTLSEIYIDKNRLVLVGNRYDTQDQTLTEQKPPESTTTSEKDFIIDSKMYMPHRYKNYSFIDIYDISDYQNPKFIKGHEMEGNYQSSRKNGETVYLITNTYVNNDIFFPLMKDTTISNNLVSLPIKDIMIMPDCKASGYLVVSAININNSGKTQVEAITTSGYTTYMNNSSLYLVGNDYNGQSTITKFNIDGMNIGYAGSGKVNGYVLNQFSMPKIRLFPTG
jgi:uncharacterized secreted protein with C-terminal beta-propeller domain